MLKTKDNEKRGFIVYATLEEQLAFLTDEQAGQLFRAMFVHFRGEEPVLEDLMVKMTYTGVRTIMDLDREKWERTREARREAGRRGGLAKAELNRCREGAPGAEAPNGDRDEPPQTPDFYRDEPSQTPDFYRDEPRRSKEQILAELRSYH